MDVNIGYIGPSILVYVYMYQSPDLGLHVQMHCMWGEQPSVDCGITQVAF